MQLSLVVKFCTAAAMAFSATSSFAAQCLAPKVLFVNGVFNSRAEAIAGKIAVREALIEGGAPADLSVGMIYNPSESGLGDLLEVAQDYQLTQGNLSFLNAVLTAGTFVPPFTGIAPFLSIWLRNQIAATEPSIRNINVETAIREAVLREIQNKRPVILVAHSQGNIYVNNVVRQLKAMVSDTEGLQAIGVVGIGVASAIDLGARFQSELYGYITRSDDIIISPLTTSSGVLPPNYRWLLEGSGTPLHHLLEADYLSSAPRGEFDNSVFSPREAVQKTFNRVYKEVSKAWPCVTIDYSANPVAIGIPTTLRAALTDRQGSPITAGTVKFSVDGGSDLGSAVAVDGGGRANVPYTFAATVGGADLRAKWTLGAYAASATTPLSFPAKLTAEFVVNLPHPPASILVKAVDADGRAGLGSISVVRNGLVIAADLALDAAGQLLVPIDYVVGSTAYRLNWNRDGVTLNSAAVQTFDLSSSSNEWFLHTGAGLVFGVGPAPAAWLINNTLADNTLLRPLDYQVSYINLPTAPPAMADGNAVIEEYVYDVTATRVVGYGRISRAAYPGPGIGADFNSFTCRTSQDPVSAVNTWRINFSATGYGPVGSVIFSDLSINLSSCGMWSTVTGAEGVINSCRRDVNQPARVDFIGSAVGIAGSSYPRIGIAGYNQYYPTDTCTN